MLLPIEIFTHYIIPKLIDFKTIKAIYCTSKILHHIKRSVSAQTKCDTWACLDSTKNMEQILNGKYNLCDIKSVQYLSGFQYCSTTLGFMDRLLLIPMNLNEKAHLIIVNPSVPYPPVNKLQNWALSTKTYKHLTGTHEKVEEFAAQMPYMMSMKYKIFVALRWKDGEISCESITI